jgi:hypothetical protein
LWVLQCEREREGGQWWHSFKFKLRSVSRWQVFPERKAPNGGSDKVTLIWVIPNEETIHVPSIYISFDFNV